MDDRRPLSVPATGEERIDAALRRVAELPPDDPEAHVAVFEQVLGELRAALDDHTPDASPPAPGQ